MSTLNDLIRYILFLPLLQVHEIDVPILKNAMLIDSHTKTHNF